MSAQPDIEDAHKVMCARRSPEGVDVEAGKSYWWCSCGRSKTQPFCDGSHKGTNFKPVEYKAEKTEKVWFCMCKQTGAQPMCDGAHNQIAVDAEGRMLLCRNTAVVKPEAAPVSSAEAAPVSSAQLALGFGVIIAIIAQQYFKK